MDVCQEYYEKYKNSSVSEKDLLEASPKIEVCSVSCVRLKAFLDKSKTFYTDTIAPFEFLLLKKCRGDKAHYEELIDVYRQTYFSYNNKDVYIGFYLEQEANESSIEHIAQAYLLNEDSYAITVLVNTSQKELDNFYLKNRNNEDTRSVRILEKQLIFDIEEKFLKLQSFINKGRKSLEALLENYPYKAFDNKILAFTSYFQDSYNLLDKDDLIEYVKSFKSFTDKQIQDDIVSIRDTVQQQIISNNILVEELLASNEEVNIREVLMQYAAKEQEFVSSYRSVMISYSTLTELKLDFLQVNKPFEMYFDNYFSDFENIVEYYKYLYTNEDIEVLSTPYYNKIHTSTKEKILVLNANYANEIEESKKNYISKREALTQLKSIKREYAQEVDALLDEYMRYGELYIGAIKSNSSDNEKHKHYVVLVRQQYDLREKNEFF